MSIPLNLRFQILKRDRFFCQCCGASPKESGVELEVDHIIPVSKEGSNEPSNLQTLCKKCNRGKSDYLPDPMEDLLEDRFSDSNVRIAFEIWFRDLENSEKYPFKNSKQTFIQVLEEYWSYPWRFKTGVYHLDPPWFKYADLAWAHGSFQIPLPHREFPIKNAIKVVMD